MDFLQMVSHQTITRYSFLVEVQADQMMVDLQGEETTMETIGETVATENPRSDHKHPTLPILELFK
jgi:hypothetical protein